MRTKLMSGKNLGLERSAQCALIDTDPQVTEEDWFILSASIYRALLCTRHGGNHTAG